MKPLYMYVAGALVVGGVAVTPVVVKQNVTSSIEMDKVSLLKHGIELQILKEEGYFNSIRDFKLTIVDGKKLRDYLFSEVNKINPQYVQVTKMLQKNSDRDINPALDGTTFSGKIQNSNLLPEDVKVEMSLTTLSTEAMKGIKDDKETSDIIMPMLNNKVLTFYITLDTNKNLKTLSLKDIDQTIVDKHETIKFQMQGQKLDLENSSDTISGNYTLAKQLVHVKGKYKDFSLENSGIKYSFDYTNQFQNSASFDLGSFTLTESKRSRDSHFKIQNAGIKSDVNAVNNAANANVKYSIKNIDFKDRGTFGLNDLQFDLGFKGLNKDAIVAISDAYSKMTFKRRTRDDVKALTKGIEQMINYGFDTTLNASISSMNVDKISLGNINFDFTGKIEKNTHKLNDSQLINALHVKGTIKLSEKDLETLAQKDRQIKEFSSLAKKEGNRAVFNLEFTKGEMLLNGKKL